MIEKRDEWFVLGVDEDEILLVSEVSEADGCKRDLLRKIETLSARAFESALEDLRRASIQLPAATRLKTVFELETDSLQYHQGSREMRGSEWLVRVVSSSSGLNRLGFEISLDTLDRLSDDALFRVFRDTFRNLLRHREFVRLEKKSLFRSLRHQFGNTLFRVGARLDQLEELSLLKEIESRKGRVLDLVRGALRAAAAAHPLLRNLSVLGGEGFRPDPGLIGDSVAESIRQFEAQAATWGVSFQLETGELSGGGGEPFLVHALMQIFENALSAQLRCPEGTIRVRVESPESGSGLWRVMIQDQGPGFPSGGLALPFLAVRAASETGKPGLGIPVILRILNAYGGSLRLRTSEGSGAEIVVELPAAI